MKVFLGGTINGSKWRDEIIPQLKIDYFNPVVDEWNDEAIIREENEKKTCDYLLFVITPRLTGLYSIAEVVDLSNKVPEKTILCVLEEDDGHVWSDVQLKSLKEVEIVVKKNGAKAFDNLDDVIRYLNDSQLSV